MWSCLLVISYARENGVEDLGVNGTEEVKAARSRGDHQCQRGE